MPTDRQVIYALSRGVSNICVGDQNLKSPFVLEALKFHSKQLKTVSVETEGEVPKDVQEFFKVNKLSLG